MKFYFCHSACVFLLLVSCSSKNTEEQPLNQVNDLAGFVWFDNECIIQNLRAKGLQATVLAPPDALIYNIKINDANVIVVQPSSASAARMNIKSDNRKIELIRSEIENSTEPDFAEWLTSDENGGIYSVVYPNSMIEYRFVFLFSSRNQSYKCYWDPIAVLNRNEAEAFYKMAKSIKSVGNGQ